MLAHYVNLGEFYDRKQLRPHAAEFIEVKKRYQASYVRAYQCLRAAHEVRCNGEKECVTDGVLAKIAKRAKGILSRELKKKKGEVGTVTQRFLDAITCQGVLCLYESIYNQCKRIYEIQDYGGTSHELLRELKNGIVEAGYDVTVFPSPEDPSRLSHLMVPELKLAFISKKGHESLEKRPYRRVRMETMVDKEEMKANRAKLRFSNRIASELLADGIAELQKAKKYHDEMESAYHPFVDFEGVNRVTKDLIKEISALP